MAVFDNARFLCRYGYLDMSVLDSDIGKDERAFVVFLSNMTYHLLETVISRRN